MHPYDKYLKDRLKALLTGSPSIHGRKTRGASPAILANDYVLLKDLQEAIAGASSSALPRVIESVAVVDETAEITPVLIDGTEEVGTYRVNYYLETLVANPTAGNLNLTLEYTDDIGLTTHVSDALDLTISDRVNSIVFLRTGDTSGITYEVSISGAASGTAPLVTRGFLFSTAHIITAGYLIGSAIAEYALFIIVEKLS